MPRITVLGRLTLLVTGHLAGYQVVAGINGLEAGPTLAYTIAFGVLLLASLLLMIFGFDALDNDWVVIVAAILPLCLSLGLVLEYAPVLGPAYLTFTVVGFLGIAATRHRAPARPAALTLASVHGVSGLVITGLPLALTVLGRAPAGFALVSLGGLLIGLGGLLLAFARSGKPIVEQKTVFALLPAILLLMTAASVVGLAAG